MFLSGYPEARGLESPLSWTGKHPLAGCAFQRLLLARGRGRSRRAARARRGGARGSKGAARGCGDAELRFAGVLRDSKYRSPLVALAASSCAGAAAAFVTTPFDVVKTRRQVQAHVGDAFVGGASLFSLVLERPLGANRVCGRTWSS